MLRNLAYRESDGISVSLDWNSATDRTAVTVEDNRSGEYFTLLVPPPSAMDAFRHPYAYRATFQDSGNGRVLTGKSVRV